MGRLKLRTFSIAIILVSATLGFTLNFSSDLLASTDQEFGQESEIRELRTGFANESNRIQGEKSQVEGVQVQTDTFFLVEIWNVIKSIPQGLVQIKTLLGQMAGLSGLSIPPALTNLVYGVITIGVIFAIVAASQGWDV